MFAPLGIGQCRSESFLLSMLLIALLSL